MANTSYLAHAADARMLFFTQNGFTLARFVSERFGPVMLREELVYRKELRLMDEVKVDFEAAGLSQDGVRFRVRNTFRNLNDDVSTILTSDGVWFDLESRKPRAPPKDLDDLMISLQRTDDFQEIPSRNSA
jgi:acyl-CoA thioester hydrolase